LAAPTPERRFHGRHRFALGGFDPPIATVGIVPRAALICDLSHTGIGLLTTQEPLVGAIVPVWMSGTPGSPSSLILGTIVHSSREPDGLYRVGLICLEESLGVLRSQIDRMTELGWFKS
jgi:hypothetical protein